MTIFIQYTDQDPEQAYSEILATVSSSATAPFVLSRQITGHQLGQDAANNANDIVATFTRYIELKHQYQEITADKRHQMKRSLTRSTINIKSQDASAIKSTILSALIADENEFDAGHDNAVSHPLP